MRKTGDETPYIDALRLLAARDYTVSAIGRKLQAKGFQPDAVQTALERLQSERLLDDRRYGERFVQTALESGRYAGYRLRQELLRRGVPKELLSELLDDRSEPFDEEHLAYTVASRRYPAFSGRQDAAQCRRIAAFLQRRGFSSGVVWNVIRKLGACCPLEGGDDLSEY